MRILFVITVLCIPAFSALAQSPAADKDAVDRTLTTDTLSQIKNRTSPSVYLQLIGGSIAYAIPFWSVNGKKYINSGEVTDAGGVLLGIVATGLAVPFIGNLTCNCKGSYWAGIGGAFLGGVIAGPIFGSINDSKSTMLKYIALSVPPVLSAIALYHLTLTDEDFDDKSSKEIFVFPSISKSFQSLNVRIQF